MYACVCMCVCVCVCVFVITGYRDDSLETVKRKEEQYGMPLKIVSYEELYGWTMDAIVQKLA